MFRSLLPATLIGSFALLMARPAQAITLFEEAEGVLSVEAESGSLVDGWVEHEPEVDGARGKARRFTAGKSICSSPQAEAAEYPAQEYHFRIHTEGVYRLRMNINKQVHCVDIGTDGASCHSGAGCESYGTQAGGDSCDGADVCWRTDISNDFYVAVQRRDGEGVPYVSGTTEIMKFFGGNPDKYAFSGNGALDHHAPDYELTAGDYTLLVRGRSRGASFDRWVLVHETADDAAARNSEESSAIEVMEDGAASGGSSGSGAGTGSGNGTSTGSPAEGSGAAANGDGSGNFAGASGGDGSASERSGGCSVAWQLPGQSGGLAALGLGLLLLVRRRRPDAR